MGEEEPTGLVLDLDPPDGADFAVVVTVARLARQALADAGLAEALLGSLYAAGVFGVIPLLIAVAITLPRNRRATPVR
ncbi:hypothetical protein A7K94_0204805 [Modestobacter sp. VKM Ac-2676]|nr:hypothetical protein A7K94_0204805 [Modestobacter sp. VKM Ac-2676]